MQMSKDEISADTASRIRDYVWEVDGCAAHITISEIPSELEDTRVFRAKYLSGSREIDVITFLTEMDGTAIATWASRCGPPGGEFQ